MLNKEICFKCCRQEAYKELTRLGSEDITWFDRAFDRHWKKHLVHCPAFFNGDIITDSDEEWGLPAKCRYLLEQLLERQTHAK